MFTHRCNNMVARADQPVDRRIEGLRRIGSKGNTGWTFGME